MRMPLSALLALAALASPAHSVEPELTLQWSGFDGGHPVLILQGPVGPGLAIQASADLLAWETRHTAVLSESPLFWTDPDPLAGPRRFYRALLLTPPRAGDPSPAHRETELGLTPLLSWTAGAGALSHDVYFGPDSPGAFMGNQTGTSFDPGPLLPNTTYYWRVDPRNENGATEGEVWSFSTAVRPSGVAYLGAGAPAASTGQITPALPAGLLPGDILIVFLQTSGPHIYLEDTNGGTWLALARKAASPQSVGTGSNEVHLTAYYSRYNGTQGAPTTNDSGLARAAASHPSRAIGPLAVGGLRLRARPGSRNVGQTRSAPCRSIRM